MEIYEKKAYLSISMINKKGKKMTFYIQVIENRVIMNSNRKFL